MTPLGTRAPGDEGILGPRASWDRGHPGTEGILPSQKTTEEMKTT